MFFLREFLRTRPGESRLQGKGDEGVRSGGHPRVAGGALPRVGVSVLRSRLGVSLAFEASVGVGFLFVLV